MTDAQDPAGESGEEQIDAEGRNPTQQRMDDEGVEPAPVDASWSGEAEGQAEVAAPPVELPGASGPVEGAASVGAPVGSAEQGAPVAAAGPGVSGGFETSARAEVPGAAASAGAPAAGGEAVFEPDVALVGEVNREAGGGRKKGAIAAVGGALALLGAVLLRRRR